LPNQLYRVADIGNYKSLALGYLIREISDTGVIEYINPYTNQSLEDMVIVATDSMTSRRIVWDQFKKQEHCRYYIEARMGAELGLIYTIRKHHNEVGQVDIEFYEKTLYSDKDAQQLPCTAKAILYNVFMIASLIGRSVKAIINSEPLPRELIFNMERINKYSFMVRE
jgi:hypothetical protein